MNNEDSASGIIMLVTGLRKKLSSDLKDGSLKTYKQTKVHTGKRRRTSTTLVSIEHELTLVRTC